MSLSHSHKLLVVAYRQPEINMFFQAKSHTFQEYVTWAIPIGG